MDVPVSGTVTPVVRLDWQRSLASGFGSSNLPLHYHQVTLSIGVSLGL